jgi:hypothetical protein
MANLHTKLHHETIKRALRLGVEIIAIPNLDGLSTFRAVRIADKAETVEIFDDAKSMLNAISEGAAEFAVPTSFRGLRSGVMVMTYHVRYTANGGGCGDTLDLALRDLLLSNDGTNLDLLQQIAEKNGVWVQKWASLNAGMQRMNLANRLRSILRNNAEATIDLGDEGTGRFDVEFEPNSRTRKAMARAKAHAG